MPAIRSANGSTRTATAATRCSRSRRGLLKNPRTYDASGIPFHRDGKTVVKEQIYLDKADKNVLYDKITVFDNALSRPWTITKKAARNPKPRPLWHTEACAEDNAMVRIGNN